nr:sulfite exporter TauE/SafE family protein [Aidingimonas lacisalsi]
MSVLDMGLVTWLGCSAILLLGSFVQRATGFGLAVVGAPLMLPLEPRLVPVVLVMFGLMVSLMMLRQYRHEIRLDAIGMALVGRIPGTVLGTWLLLIAPLAVLETTIAGIVLFAVAVSLARFSLPVTRGTLFLAGVLSGIFGTVSAIGGPPIALLMQRLPPDSIRGNLAAFFTVSATMTLCALGLVGHISLWHIGLAVTFVPAILLGNGLAKVLSPRMDPRIIRLGSLALCTTAAIGLLI